MRRLLHRSLLALLVSGCAVASPARALEWRHVVSPAHGTEIDIPIDLVDRQQSDMVGGRFRLRNYQRLTDAPPQRAARKSNAVAAGGTPRHGTELPGMHLWGAAAMWKWRGEAQVQLPERLLPG
jgi:hypothetical protein